MPGMKYGIHAGYFDDLEKLALAACRYSGLCPGVYVTLNPLDPRLLLRSANHVQKLKNTTKDSDIQRRRWLPVDFDPLRPTGISSTNEEHDFALARARECRSYLIGQGWPEPLLADSGNGGHVLCCVDLPNDDDSRELLRRVLSILGKRFTDGKVAVDQSTFNASRIWKLYGTMACKGDNSPDCPHRLATIINAPASVQLTPAPLDLLQQLAGEILQAARSTSRKQSTQKTAVDLGDWLRRHNLVIDKEGSWNGGGRMYVLATCPLNSEHMRTAHVEQHASGAISAGCLHKSCTLDWPALRAIFSKSLPATSFSGAASDSWQDPEPLGEELPAVPEFDLELLPKSLRALVEDTAERMQVPLDYPAIVSVLCLAGVTNRRALIQPKARDTSWTEVANLWGGIVAPPGLMKSPVFAAVTYPLKQMEAVWRAEYETELEDYQQEKEEAELRLAAWRDQFKAAQKAKDKVEPPCRPDSSIAAPVCRRLLTTDATLECLHKMLAENPAGITVLRDELTGWLAQLDKLGREGERAFYLSAWNGNTGHTIDRIGRGSVYVPACCVSIMGGIQPARLRTYLADALRDGPANDGLIQRFQVLIYPDPPAGWRYVDRLPNFTATQTAEKVYRRLIEIDASQPVRLRFAPDAQELFTVWLYELETKSLRNSELHPALVSHFAKYRKLVPVLALLFELADNAEAESVSLEHTQQSAAFSEYLQSHARRIYSMNVSPEKRAAINLAHHLSNAWKHETGIFSIRDVERNAWSGLTEPEDARKATSLLESAGWIRREKGNQGVGRPSEMYRINPKIKRGTK